MRKDSQYNPDPHMCPFLLKRNKINKKISISDIDKNALSVIRKLNSAGFTAYLVGGGVRDLLLGRKPKDFDIVTNAKPRQIRHLFHNAFLIGRRFRLALIIFNHTDKKTGISTKQQIETSTFRRAPDESFNNKNNNSSLYQEDDNSFGTPKEDAQRRDFTANALFYDINSSEIIDYTGGIKDIEKGVLRSIGDPNIRFREDPVRMLRAIRLAARLDFKIHSDSIKAISRHGSEIVNASKPRLFEEIMRLFAFSKSEASFKLLWTSKLMQHLLPEINEYINCTGGIKSHFWKYLAAFDSIFDSLNTENKNSFDYVSDTAIKMATLLLPIYIYEAKAQRINLKQQSLSSYLTLSVFSDCFTTNGWRLPKLTCQTVENSLDSIEAFKDPYLSVKRKKLFKSISYTSIEALWRIKAVAEEDHESIKIIDSWHNAFVNYAETKFNLLNPNLDEANGYDMFPSGQKNSEEAPKPKKKRRRHRKHRHSQNNNAIEASLAEST